LDWPIRDTYLYEHFYDYIYQMFEWSNEDGFIKPMLQGVSLQQVHDVYFTGTAFMAETQSYYGAYSVSLSKASSSYQLDAHALRAIEYIAKLPFNEQNKQVFYYFLETWGTSVIADEIDGGFLQFGCIVQSAIWHWGGQGQVTSDFVKGEAAAYFRDKTQGTKFTSGVFSQNSVCDFYCTGGNPEKCPTSSDSVNSQWASTIWADPMTVKYDVIPLSEVITDSNAKLAIQKAIYAYYADQVDPWQKYVATCSECLPALSSFVVAANVPFNTPTTVKAGTCNTAIRLTAWGSCFFVMLNNDSPINGGSRACDYHNTALWGVAAIYGVTNPIVEWIVTEVEQDNTFSSFQCNYPEVQCNYWNGHYSVFCL